MRAAAAPARLSRGVRWSGALLVLLLAALLVVPERPPAATGSWIAAAGLEAGQARVDGRRIRYVRSGSGPALVLIHGFASSLYTWKDVLGPLSRAHEVVALDLPGFGGSDQPPDLSFEMLPAAVVGIMDALAIPRATLVGSSLGGATAVLVAARHADRVRGLVLIDAAGFNLSPSSRPAMVRLAGSGPGALAERLPLRRPLVRLALRQVFHDDALVTPERVEEYLAPLSRPGAFAAMRSLTRSGPQSPDEFAAVARAVRAPTLVVWGGQDAWIPVAHADLFVGAIPGSRKVVLDACGHLPQEERPADVVRLIEGSLREAAQPARGEPRP